MEVEENLNPENQRLREIRKALDLTQEELATIAMMPKAAISKMETGRQSLSTELLAFLKKSYNVSPDWLLFGEGEMFAGNNSPKSNIAHYPPSGPVNTNIHTNKMVSGGGKSDTTIGLEVENRFLKEQNADLKKQLETLQQRYDKLFEKLLQ